MNDYEKNLAKAFRYLSYRSRSEKELREYLAKKQTSQEILEKIIIFLKEHRFLSDEAFARWFLDQRLRSSPRSLGVIKQELKQKGISKEIIEQTISNFKFQISNSPEGASEGVDLETAKKLVDKRMHRYKGLSREEVYQKLGGYLARRGFNWETIKRSIDYAYEDERG